MKVYLIHFTCWYHVGTVFVMARNLKNAKRLAIKRCKAHSLDQNLIITDIVTILNKRARVLYLRANVDTGQE